MGIKDLTFWEPIVLFAISICELWFLGYAPDGEFAFATPSIAATVSFLLLLGIFAFYSVVTSLNRSDRESKVFGNYLSHQLEVVERRFLSTCHRSGVNYSISSPCEITKLRERMRSLSPCQSWGTMDSEIDVEIEYKLGQFEALVFQQRDAIGIVIWIDDVNELCLELVECIELRERLLVVHP